MIAPIQKPKGKRNTPAWHERFLELLPEIERRANIATKHMRGERRVDAIGEILAHVTCAFARLEERDKLDVAFPSVLVRHALMRYREGRRTGSRLNRNDVLTEYGRQKNGLLIESLEQIDQEDDDWRQLLLQDHRASPGDLAMWRIDLGDWLKQLRPGHRQVALKLAEGDTTNAAAKRFHVTPGRISQLRRQLEADWDRFYTDPELAGTACPAARRGSLPVDRDATLNLLVGEQAVS